MRANQTVNRIRPSRRVKRYGSIEESRGNCGSVLQWAAGGFGGVAGLKMTEDEGEALGFESLIAAAGRPREQCGGFNLVPRCHKRNAAQRPLLLGLFPRPSGCGYQGLPNRGLFPLIHSPCHPLTLRVLRAGSFHPVISRLAVPVRHGRHRSCRC
jgi:hypothetical protein